MDLIDSVKRRAQDPRTRTDRADAHPPELGGTLPEGVIAAMERELSLEFPETLRRLYAEVGDGGFGPGYGFLRMSTATALDEETVADLYQSLHGPDLSDSSWHWPDGLLLVCEWGRGIRAGVVCPTNRVVVFDPNLHDSDWSDTFLDQDCTLDEWLQKWCDGVDLWKEILESAERRNGA